MYYENHRNKMPQSSCRRTTQRVGLMFLFVLLFAILMTLPSFAAQDASQSADGLEISILSNQDSYSAGEEVILLVSITNRNMYDVEGVSIQTFLPETFVIRTGAEAYENLTIPAGETYETSLITLVKEISETESDSLADSTTEIPADTAPETSPTGPAEPDSLLDQFMALINAISAKFGGTIVLRMILIAVLVLALVLIALLVGKNKTRYMSFFLAMLLLLQVSIPMVSAIQPDMTSAEVEKTIVYDGESYTLKAKVTWQKDLIPSDEPDPATYTRGEWLRMLADAFDIPENQTILPAAYFYGDSVDSEYGTLAETFHVLGVLPAPDSEGYEDPSQDIPLFEADRTVTREFAACTVAKLLGFIGDYTCDAADMGSITYQNEVAVLVMLNFMTLDLSGFFRPMDPLTATDAIRIFNRIDSYTGGADEDTSSGDETKDYLALQSGVVHIQNVPYSVTDQGDGTYTAVLSGVQNPEDLTEGRVILLSPSEETLYEYALKIQSMETDGHTFLLTCTEPELDEVLLEIDYQNGLDANGFELVGADGVVAEYDPNGSMDVDDEVQPFDFDEQSTKGLPGKLVFTFVDKELGNSGVKLNGKVKMAFPQIATRVRGSLSFFGGLKLKEVSVELKQEIDIEGGFTYDFGIPETSYDVQTGNVRPGTGKTEIGRASLPLAPGLHADLVFFVNFTLEGQLKITYEIDGAAGFQYKDGAFRLIHNYQSKFRNVELNAEAKIGVGISPRLSLFSVFDLVGLDIHGGLGLYGGYTAHVDTDPVLHCAEISAYFYLTMDMDKYTLVGAILDLLNLSWEWEIYDRSNSPLKAAMHFENGSHVEKCTYGRGDILGSVKSASTGEPIGGAKVNIYNVATGALVTSKLTERVDLWESGFQLYRGEFQVKDLPVGEYRIDVFATGYQTYSIIIKVLPNQPTVCEAALMLLRDDIDGDGFVQGDIIDALTGQPLSGTDCVIRKGWNMTSGESVMETHLAGSTYAFELAPGNYTIEISKEEFITGYINVVVNSGYTTIKDITVTPTHGIEIQDGGFRVVLTWGSSPSDLDSYLICRDSNMNVEYYTYYSDKSHYEGYSQVANLDVDDTTGYGPETSTVYRMDPNCTYSFWVHNYSDRFSNNSNDMSYSGAQVKLYSGEVLLATFNILEHREGTLWRVFDYDASTGTFTYVNEMGYTEHPSGELDD